MAPLSEASKLALSRLRAYKPPPTSWHSAPVSRRAAVLILLFPDRTGELRVVLTMRSSSLSSYSGQAALPGGKADDETETPFDCARREADEEIGLPREVTDTGAGDSRQTTTTTTACPDSTKKEEKDRRKRRLPKGFWVEELCEMPTNLARTELVVRPCVAYLHNSKISKDPEGRAVEVEGGSVEENMLPQLDAREVAAVFSAPFRNFLYTRDLAMVQKKTSSDDTDVDDGRRSVSSSSKPTKVASKVNSTEVHLSLPPGSWYQGTWIDWHQQHWRMHNFFVPVNNQSVFKPRHTREGSRKNADDQLDGLERYKVWGMTARILVDAARFAYNQEPEFDHNAHFGDEEMINRLRKIGKLGDIRRPGEVLTREDMRRAANL